MKSVVIALVPGLATGWCILDAQGRVRATSAWGTGELVQSLDFLIRSLHMEGYEVAAAVVEDATPAKETELGKKVGIVRAHVVRVTEETYEVKTVRVPRREWQAKPARGVPIKFGGEPVTAPQRDAIRMGRYWQGLQRAR